MGMGGGTGLTRIGKYLLTSLTLADDFRNEGFLRKLYFHIFEKEVYSILGLTPGFRGYQIQARNNSTKEITNLGIGNQDYLIRLITEPKPKMHTTSRSRARKSLKDALDALESRHSRGRRNEYCPIKPSQPSRQGRWGNEMG